MGHNKLPNKGVANMMTLKMNTNTGLSNARRLENNHPKSITTPINANSNHLTLSKEDL